MIKMYTSEKRQHVNAFASRLLRVVHETEQRDQECKDEGRTNRDINNIEPGRTSPQYEEHGGVNRVLEGAPVFRGDF